MAVLLINVPDTHTDSQTHDITIPWAPVEAKIQFKNSKPGQLKAGLTRELPIFMSFER